MAFEKTKDGFYVPIPQDFGETYGNYTIQTVEEDEKAYLECLKTGQHFANKADWYMFNVVGQALFNDLGGKWMYFIKDPNKEVYEGIVRFVKGDRVFNCYVWQWVHKFFDNPIEDSLVGKYNAVKQMLDNGAQMFEPVEEGRYDIINVF